MALNYFRIVIGLLLLLEVLVYSKIQAAGAPQISKPFYVGINGGMGSTTWGFLVPVGENKKTAVSISTPIYVIEGGGVYGGFAGYEFTPYFALEAGYRHYPKAKVTFDIYSFYAYDHDGDTFFETKTETVNLMAKVMLTLPRTEVRLFSSIGIAGLHRVDKLLEHWRGTPTFGAGFNANLNEHFMVEIGFNYTTGFAESELNPANKFIPFLYSATLGLAYRV